MADMKTSPRPKPRPASMANPLSTKRPKKRPADLGMTEGEKQKLERGLGRDVRYYKKGGMISEYGGKEKYTSKKAMAQHERAETPAKERMEKMAMGGKCRGMGAATKGGKFVKNG